MYRNYSEKESGQTITDEEKKRNNDHLQECIGKWIIRIGPFKICGGTNKDWSFCRDPVKLEYLNEYHMVVRRKTSQYLLNNKEVLDGLWIEWVGPVLGCMKDE